MPVVDVDVHSREQYHIDGYERIDGRLRYAVDPSAAANAAITDLHLAPTDADGRVRFSGDFCLIHSTSGDDGPTRVLVDVCNRGRKIAVKDFCHGAPSAVQRDSRPGDGFLFHHGFAVLSLGWQWDTFSSDSLLGLDVPLLADAAGNAVSGQASVEIWPNAPAHTWSLASREHKRYPADTTAPAVLLVCDYPGGPQQVVPRSSWSFAREADQTGSAGSIVFSGPVVPSKEHIYFENGFTPVSRNNATFEFSLSRACLDTSSFLTLYEDPKKRTLLSQGKYYNFVYTAEAANLAGAGLLAVRDAACWLRQPSAINLLQAPAVRTSFLFSDLPLFCPYEKR
jgi:hypothetical protein